MNRRNFALSTASALTVGSMCRGAGKNDRPIQLAFWAGNSLNDSEGRTFETSTAVTSNPKESFFSLNPDLDPKPDPKNPKYWHPKPGAQDYLLYKDAKSAFDFAKQQFAIRLSFVIDDKLPNHWGSPIGDNGQIVLFSYGIGGSAQYTVGLCKIDSGDTGIQQLALHVQLLNDKNAYQDFLIRPLLNWREMQSLAIGYATDTLFVALNGESWLTAKAPPLKKLTGEKYLCFGGAWSYGCWFSGKMKKIAVFKDSIDTKAVLELSKADWEPKKG